MASQSASVWDTADLDPALRTRLEALLEEGWEIWDRFDNEVRQRHFHPFVPADYERMLEVLLSVRSPGLRFLEWGSATGVITIMADMLGFEAYGIEIDASLVGTARELASKHQSGARFAAGSFLPTGYEWKPSSNDRRTGTIGHAPSAYLELGHPLEDFDLVYGYPWNGEAPLMLDLARQYGGKQTRLLLHGGEGVQVYRNGRLEG